MLNKLEHFRALVEAQTKARYTAEWERDRKYYDLAVHAGSWVCKVKIGRKYANVDVGKSGKYMVELSTGNIYGIKGYGVIHRGHSYGNLDTTHEYFWGEYTAHKLTQAA